MIDPVMFAVLLFAAAALYAAVGHGGASAYIALMALAGFAPADIRPLALVLNLFVSAIAFWQFRMAGAFDRRLFILFAGAAVPMAFVGGAWQVDGDLHRWILGIVLIASAIVLAWRPAARSNETRRPSVMHALPTGAGLGLVAGITGTGGGIFLSPLLILMRWADARTVAGVSAAFIFCNSAAGLAGQLAGHWQGDGAPLLALPAATPAYIAAVIAGGLIGSRLSATRLPRAALLRLLSIVLLIAGGKLLAG